MECRPVKQVKKITKDILHNLRNFRFNSILLRYFLLISVLVLVPMCAVAAIFNFNYQKTIREEITVTNAMTLQRSADMIENVTEQLYNFAYNLSVRSELKWLLTQDIESAYSKQVVSELWGEIDFYKKTFEYMDSIYIYFEKQQVVISEGEILTIAELKDQNWMSTYESMEKNSYVFCSRKKNDFYPYYLTMICPVHIWGNELAGAIVLNINMKQMGAILGDSPNQSQQLYMTDDEQNLYYASDYTMVESSTVMPLYMSEILDKPGNFSEPVMLNGEKTIVSCIRSQRYGWKYLYCSSLSMYESQLNRTNQLFFRMGIFVLLIGLVVAYMLTMKSYEPIRVILNEVNSASVATEEFYGQPKSQNEIQYITNLVRHAQLENSQMKLQLADRMQKLNLAQVRALQNQINPHFLYNTLDTANWLAIDCIGMHNPVSKLIVTLGQLLRISLLHNSHLIPLREELEHAKLYVQIMEMCYPNKLMFHWSIQPDLLEHNVVTFCLQPLIENAIQHGLRAKRGQGNIYIGAERLADSSICLSVSDDGVGMEEKQLQEQNNSLELSYQTVKQHVGLSNVNQRIKILFGDQYGIQLFRREGGGLTVKISLPAHE